mgnify:CR=1 FL=1
MPSFVVSCASAAAPHGVTSHPSPQISFYPAWQIVLSRRLGRPVAYDPLVLGPSDPIPSRKTLRGAYHEARQAGAEFVLLLGGTGFEDLSETADQVRYLGYHSFTEYLADACILATETRGPGNKSLRPVISLGSLRPADVQGLAEVVDHLRIDIELVPAHPVAGLPPPPPVSPLTLLSNRLKPLLGLPIPLVASIYVGLGETNDDVCRAFESLAKHASRGLNLHAVALRSAMLWPGLPGDSIAMPSIQRLMDLLVAARRELPPTVQLYLQSEGREDVLELLRSGQHDSAGFLVLNASLPSGLRVGQWFERQVGPANYARELARRRSSAEVRALQPGSRAADAARQVVHAPAPALTPASWSVTPEGALFDGQATWRSLSKLTPDHEP